MGCPRPGQWAGAPSRAPSCGSIVAHHAAGARPRRALCPRLGFPSYCEIPYHHGGAPGEDERSRG
jgi:hypothetical protein